MSARSKPQASRSRRACSTVAMRALAALQRFELRRRNAEAEQRRRLVHEPADVALLEQRRDLLVEDAAAARRGSLACEDALRVAPVRARQQMPRGDEAAEQAVAVDVAAEVADAPAPDAVAALPVVAGGASSIRREIALVGLDVVRVLASRRSDRRSRSRADGAPPRA